ncbi:MAG: hypothetical protein NZZ60_04875 [Bacteroidia bacterium]|nr:hypothetical protein [Bacteroidia bacterium]MCX7652755.1 hypothetical protein [Bacteroidia bacterium]MDW8417412.1 hypothetical protein [Bacteroidia bacterium]
MRWASLAPEATLWILTAKGMQALAGRSHLCTTPPAIQKFPICTRPNAHREGWELYLGPYAPDYGVLSTLRLTGVAFLAEEPPVDLSESELYSLFQKAIGHPVQLMPIRARDWNEYEALFQKIKSALSGGRDFERWFDEQKRKLSKLASLAQRIIHKPAVAFIEPTTPLTIIGSWSTQICAWSGGAPLHKEGGRISLDELLRIDPEVIVLSVRGGTLRKAGEALAQWARLPHVQGLSAFRQKRLYAFMGTAGLFYPSPLTISAAEGIYELLHTPSYRYNQHIGKLWASLL